MADSSHDWLVARKLLIDSRLIIRKEITGSKQDVQDLREIIRRQPGLFRRKRIQRALTIYLESSKREKIGEALFKEVSQLLYELHSTHVTNYELMCFMSELSDRAIKYFKQHKRSDIASLRDMRDALLETREHLIKKEEKS